MIDLLIDEEAQRIINIIIDMYNKNTKTKKIFNSLVYDLMKDEFKLYEFHVMHKVVDLIPRDLTISLDEGKIFTSNTEKKENKIVYRQTNTNLKKEIIEKIIDDVTKNSLKKQDKSILEIIYQNITKKDLINLESRDITYIIRNVLDKLEKDYIIKSYNPLIIEKNCRNK